MERKKSANYMILIELDQTASMTHFPRNFLVDLIPGVHVRPFYLLLYVIETKPLSLSPFYSNSIMSLSRENLRLMITCVFINVACLYYCLFLLYVFLLYFFPCLFLVLFFPHQLFFVAPNMICLKSQCHS